MNRRNPYMNPPLNPRLPHMMTLGNVMNQSTSGGVLTTAQSAGAHLTGTQGGILGDAKDAAETLVKGAAIVGGAVLAFQVLNLWQTYAERKNIRIAAGLDT